MNYRDRCYGSYISTHWNYSHSLSEREYEHFAKVAGKMYSRFLPSVKDAKILDVACGAGHFLYFLQKQGYTNARGIDLSAEQLEAAENAGAKNLQQADLFEYLPECEEKFDMIIAFDIIEHLTKNEVIEFLDLIYKSLSAEGLVLIGAPNVQTLLGTAGRYCDFTHEQGFTPGSLSQVMRVCGFRDVDVFGEKPVVSDFRSAIRSVLWWWTCRFLSFYNTVARGTGRGMRRRDNIFEPRMFAVGKK